MDGTPPMERTLAQPWRTTRSRGAEAESLNPWAALADGQLVAQTLSGRPDAYGELVRRHQAAVYNVAFRLVGERQDALDAAQETFVRAYINLASYRPGTRFASWLLAITVHWCVDQRRRQACRARYAALPERRDGREADRPDGADGPETLALVAERRRAVGAWVGVLPADQRQVLHLYYAQELSYVEIAETLGQPISTIRMRLHRARQRLARAGHPEYARAE
jgi:RNA polymerase sigma-70 factor, ECF subfamily